MISCQECRPNNFKSFKWVRKTSTVTVFRLKIGFINVSNIFKQRKNASLGTSRNSNSVRFSFFSAVPNAQHPVICRKYSFSDMHHKGHLPKLHKVNCCTAERAEARNWISRFLLPRQRPLGKKNLTRTLFFCSELLWNIWQLHSCENKKFFIGWRFAVNFNYGPWVIVQPVGVR